MALSGLYTFVGAGDWSLDATSGSATGGGVMQVSVPVGSVVLKAFLYESTFGGSAGSVDLTGAASASIAVSGFTSLGTAGFLTAYRADVTDFVRGVVGAGSNSLFNFTTSNVTGGDVDGTALVVVYSNPTKAVTTISLLDGFSAQGGDGFTANFTAPINTTVPGFAAEMSLGIGYSYQNNGTQQQSNVTVNGRPLTSSAGGEDDGISTNGGLITIGGLGDSTNNPDPTVVTSGPRTDDELYDLAKGNILNPAPFINNGDTTITVTTNNPSFDDNIFFAGFKITGVASIDTSTNDAPVAVSDGGAGFRTSEAAAFKTGNVLTNDFDPDGDAIHVSGIDTTGTKGIVTSNGDGTFNYNPNGQFDALNTGDLAFDTFSYTISDGVKTAVANVVVTIDGRGGGPVTAGDYIQLGNGDDNVNYTSRTSRIVLNTQGGDDLVIGTRFNDSINGGTGNDRLSGGGGKDVLRGGAGTDRLNGGTGDDTFLFFAGDLMPLRGDADHITDFHGAHKVIGDGENDFIGLAGFGAGATLTFAQYGANQSLQYYKVVDPTNHARDGYILVQMADGTQQLSVGDYAFF